MSINRSGISLGSTASHGTSRRRQDVGDETWATREPRVRRRNGRRRGPDAGSRHCRDASRAGERADIQGSSAPDRRPPAAIFQNDPDGLLSGHGILIGNGRSQPTDRRQPGRDVTHPTSHIRSATGNGGALHRRCAESPTHNSGASAGGERLNRSGARNGERCRRPVRAAPASRHDERLAPLRVIH